jgi:[protein-PII] uridylyltransferase
MDVRAFYEAKTLEQQQRHLKYHDTAYNLEPNIKESPGGLRDLQTGHLDRARRGPWLFVRELAHAGLITMSEARMVSRQERLIGSLRVRLHYLAGRREDRLVFDLQNALADQLQLVDNDEKQASEQLMQRYYRAAKLVRQFNVIMLQNLHARLFPTELLPTPLDDDFQVADELLDVRDEHLFERRPGAMLDAFLAVQRHPEVKGMSARTLRSLWRNRHRVDGKFRHDPANRARFLAGISASRVASHTSCGA